MKSIRRRLLAWFLPGLVLLWLAAGAGVFFSYRAGLLAGLDAELQSLLRQVRSTAGPGGGPGWGAQRRDPPVPEDFGPDVYWQTWQPEGPSLQRSSNLTDDLPRPDAAHGAVRVCEHRLPDGTSVMLATSRYGTRKGADAAAGGGGRWGGGGRGGAVEVSVAKDLATVHRSLARLLAGIAAAGLAVAALVIWWVRFAVRDGLAPLHRIAEDVAAVDASSLGIRFTTDPLPEELQPIARRLDDLMARLEAGFARERRFSSDLAHEMRTPLAELRVLADSAIKWPEEGGGEAWHEVRDAALRMERVVQSMLQLARLEQTGQAPAREAVDLAAMLGSVWTPLAARAAERRLRLESNLRNAAVVEGDPDLWRHLLLNLLENAVEHADEGGVIAVSVHAGEDRWVGGISITNPASQLRNEDAERMFDRFWRADAARSDARHCGLGLAIALACARAMDLELRARLLPGDVRPRQLEMSLVPPPIIRTA